MSGIVITLWLIGLAVAIMFQPVLGPLVYYMVDWMHPEKQMYGGLNLRWGMVLAVVSLISYLYIGSRRVWPGNALTVILIIFSIWYFSSALVNNVNSQEFSLAVDFIKIILMCVITASVINTRLRIHALIWIVVIAIGMASFRTGLITVLSAGSKNVLGPPFLGETNEYARFVIYTWPLMLFLSRHSAHAYVRYGFMALAGISVFALIGTNSRGAMVAFAAMCFILWLYSSRKITYMLIAGALASIFYFAASEKRLESFTNRQSTITRADEDNSFLGRTRAWEWGWAYVQKNPVLGGGPGVYERIHGRASHNSYFEVLGESGFVGFALWSVIALLTLNTILRIRRLSKGIPDLLWAYDLSFFIMITMAGYFVGGITKNHGMNEYYYMLIAILMGTEIAVRNYLISQAREEDLTKPHYHMQQSSTG